MSEQLITLYDIQSKVGAWSPNTWKTRFVLNYKQLPYKTEWVSLPDVEPILRSIGAKPAGDGGLFYSLPVIEVRPTIIEDSGKIAAYFEKKCPDHPLFPEGSLAMQSIVVDWLCKEIMWPQRLSLPLTPHILDERGAHYWRESRKRWYGQDVEEFAKTGQEREEAWEHVEKAHRPSGIHV